MRGFTKLMLVLLVLNAVAAVLFLTGIVNVSSVPGFYLTFPLAAIFYGLFLICMALDKEVTKFHDEEHAHHNHAAIVGQPDNIEHLHSHNHSHDHHDSLAA